MKTQRKYKKKLKMWEKGNPGISLCERKTKKEAPVIAQHIILLNDFIFLMENSISKFTEALQFPVGCFPSP